MSVMHTNPPLKVKSLSQSMNFFLS